MTDVLTRRGLRPVINAAGTMTTLGASRVSPEIAAEVADMLGRFVAMDDLMAHASMVIARLTGAEAGVVTSSSAAAMTLGVAAALVGDDLAAIEALPATGGRERRVAVQMGHMVNYGAPVPQAIAAAGAEVVPLGTACLTETYHLEAAARAGLAAIVHVVSHHTVREGELPLPLVLEIAAAHGVPVIVDMASEYDLRGPVALGAAATIWSGHKFLGGPTSGIVAGPRAMMRALALQNRGLGRLMKVGKEGVIGAVAALEAWERRDPAAIRRAEEAIVTRWAEALEGLPGVTLARLPDWTGNPITRLQLTLDPATAGLHAWELATRLYARTPRIALRDDHAEHQRLQMDPCNVTEAEAEEVAKAVREEVQAARAKGDGGRVTWEEVKRERGRAGVGWLEGLGANSFSEKGAADFASPSVR